MGEFDVLKTEPIVTLIQKYVVKIQKAVLLVKSLLLFRNSNEGTGKLTLSVGNEAHTDH